MSDKEVAWDIMCKVTFEKFEDVEAIEPKEIYPAYDDFNQGIYSKIVGYRFNKPERVIAQGDIVEAMEWEDMPLTRRHQYVK